MTDPRRRLPSVDKLLALPEVQALARSAPRNLIVAAARDAVAAARDGRGDGPDDWAAEIVERVGAKGAASLFPMINATGVVLHTNLGRAPLAPAALAAMHAVGGGYSNLELDVATGSRGSRLDHAASIVAEITGAEDGLVVNNAAGGLVLALNALADGREAIISRGELIEIGGSFRIPDIMAKSGARLREIGTTNRTHLGDYQRAISPETGLILVVHRSNFAMSGFVASPPIEALAALAREAGLPLVFDLGSGLLTDLAAFGLTGEPLVPAATRHADLVIFSGDKLLGGPQAGIVAGRAQLLAMLRKNPYARALRADKLTLAALQATLALYRDENRARREIPVLRMLTESSADLAHRAERLVELIPEAFRPATRPGASAVGGGSFPDAELPTTLVTLDPGALGAHALALKLRLANPSVLCRVEGGQVLLDPRTVPPDLLPDLAAAIIQASL